jgi:hypothetical protein
MEVNRALGVAIISGSEGTTATAVHMDIDETRHDQLLSKVSGAFRGLTTPNRCDPIASNAQPTRPENLGSADHRRGGDDVLAHSVSVTLAQAAGARLRSAPENAWADRYEISISFSAASRAVG